MKTTTTLPASSLNQAYLGRRNDVLGLVGNDCKRVLDVGCSTGALGRALKEHGPMRVVGMELLPEAAAIAEQHLDRVITGDVEALLAADALSGERFDTVIMADVLEHLRDPWTALRHAAEQLAPGGALVASIPNVRHMSTLFSLVLLGRWPYRERGIHDHTHLRFFTKRNIEELFEGAGLRIETMRTNYRIIEAPHPLNRIAKYLAWPGVRGFLAFQYLVRARRM